MKIFQWGFFIIGLFAYAGVIAWTGISSLGSWNLPPVPSEWSQFIVIVGTILSTNLGAVAGISQFNPDNKDVSKRDQIKKLAKTLSRPGTEAQPKPKGSSPAQIFAAGIYALCLVAAAVLWVAAYFKNGNSSSTDPLIRETAVSLVGVVFGVLTTFMTPQKT